MGTVLIGYELTWSGRQLMEMSMNGAQYTFQYNDEGIRTSKISSSIEHRYTLNGSQIVSEAWVTKNTDGDENVVHFLVYLYDESGAPIGLQYRNEDYQKYTFDTYYFEKNLQGDIIAIYTEAGVKIGSYTYDAWGYCTPLPEPDATTFQKRVVRTLNPFRYRGYYYDTETSLYYLQSRYYNPAWGRFLNADGYVSTGTGLLGYNMYAYCDNNPVNNYDPSGYFGIAALVGITLASVIIGGAAQLLSNALAGKTGSELWRGVAGAAVGGGVNSLTLCLALPTGGASLFIAAGLSAEAQTGVDTVEAAIRKEPIKLGQTALDLGINFSTTLAGNFLSSKIIPTNPGWFQPQKFLSVFTKSYGQKILMQTAIGAGLSGTVNFVRKNDWEKTHSDIIEKVITNPVITNPVMPTPVFPVIPLYEVTK